MNDATGSARHDITHRTLLTYLDRFAAERPDTVFVVADEVRWTYGEVHDRVRRIAAGLHALGVQRGDVVSLLLASDPIAVPLVLAVNRLGAIWTPVNTDYRGTWLADTLADAGSGVLVVDGAHVGAAAEVLDRSSVHTVVVVDPQSEGGQPVDLGSRRVVSIDELGHDVPDVVPIELRYDDTAAILWTSGTTGRSKGVMQSHNTWIRAALSGADGAATVDGDVMYCCVPMYNSAGWSAMIFRALCTGNTVAIDPQFSVSDFWARIRHYGATQTFTLGAMHMFLWQLPEHADDADNPLRAWTAVPLPDSIRAAFKRRYGIARHQQGYGQSEVMTLITRLDDGSTSWNPGAAGVVQEGLQVRLLDDDDEEVPVGEVGEFCVRPDGPAMIFNGYYNNPQATLAAFRNLWYHTGDLGRVDADGQYHFVDRKADYVRYKGRSISSFDVERTLGGHPAVAQVAAFGVTSAELEHEAELMVSVVLRPGTTATPEQLARFVNDNAPYFVVPRYIDIVDQLPYTPTGKVQKFKLREQGAGPQTWDRQASGFVLDRGAPPERSSS